MKKWNKKIEKYVVTTQKNEIRDCNYDRKATELIVIVEIYSFGLTYLTKLVPILVCGFLSLGKYFYNLLIY